MTYALGFVLLLLLYAGVMNLYTQRTRQGIVLLALFILTVPLLWLA
ncbi:MAG: hypothetical protein Q7R88_00215 [bacterium]|nr:hypothetical protein [bacterium]